MSTSSSTHHSYNFRLLPEIDKMQKLISDLELEQTRVEAARAREDRKEEALRAMARAQAAAQMLHESAVKNRTTTTTSSSSSATGGGVVGSNLHQNQTPEEIEQERLDALRCASTASEAFSATYEAAWTTSSLKDLLQKEEQLMKETADISEEARRFAHFSELGSVSSPVVRAAIYHLWDVDARNQPCRCASCGGILLLQKQYVNDKVVDVFCAKCTAENHRKQLYRDNLDLQEFYLRKTFDRIEDSFAEDFKVVTDGEEPSARRMLEVEQELQWQLLVEDRFKNQNAKEWREIRQKLQKRQFTGVGVL